MIDEDETPKKPLARLSPLPLDPLGLAELGSYREELRAEIIRVEAEMTRKEGHRTAADAFFRQTGRD
ncbi:MAG TPA: DUF1192 domain-containing protein [Acetobacteraceae bacterium]|jgi:uncharacterized small protein (DUF1192 family)|nr:DUF1192 domain-containing protein [Acetobacteraceae bacterium]